MWQKQELKNWKQALSHGGGGGGGILEGIRDYLRAWQEKNKKF